MAKEEHREEELTEERHWRGKEDTSEFSFHRQKWGWVPNVTDVTYTHVAQPGTALASDQIRGSPWLRALGGNGNGA